MTQESLSNIEKEEEESCMQKCEIEYCESFTFGQGCKYMAQCKAYRQQKNTIQK